MLSKRQTKWITITI